jgi:polyhydroxyalkanoate synthase subunit PhaC
MLSPFGFALSDVLRRQAGAGLDLCGMGPIEAGWREVARFPGARLRAYQTVGKTGPIMLILPAPFKRAYIWDLLPPVSVVRAALRRGARVYLLEWLVPGPGERDFGLAKYAMQLPEQAVDAITRETGERQIALVGHSIGGTFAAIFASVLPDRVSRLGLIDAPIAFADAGGPIAESVTRAPHARRLEEFVGSPVAGSAIDLFSVGAVPEAFLLQRWTDFFASLASPEAMAVHLRVVRWTLDEFPLPGRLFEEIAEDLYRLTVSGKARFRSGARRRASTGCEPQW